VISVDLDAAKTKVSYVVGDILHTVYGTFRLVSGHISFDPATNVVTGNVTVDAASGNSGNATRDKRMIDDILEAQRYPEIRFAPAMCTGSLATVGGSNVEVTGLFFIHGQSHKITIPMQIRISQEQVAATGKFVVPYVQWGMKNPSNFFLRVSDKVGIDITAVGHLNVTRSP
jgi:polyisoprenoid-binding protein YceI